MLCYFSAISSCPACGRDRKAENENFREWSVKMSKLFCSDNSHKIVYSEEKLFSVKYLFPLLNI